MLNFQGHLLTLGQFLAMARTFNGGRDLPGLQKHYETKGSAYGWWEGDRLHWAPEVPPSVTGPIPWDPTEKALEALACTAYHRAMVSADAPRGFPQGYRLTFHIGRHVLFTESRNGCNRYERVAMRYKFFTDILRFFPPRAPAPTVSEWAEPPLPLP